MGRGASQATDRLDEVVEEVMRRCVAVVRRWFAEWRQRFEARLAEEERQHEVEMIGLRMQRVRMGVRLRQIEREVGF